MRPCHLAVAACLAVAVSAINPGLGALLLAVGLFSGVVWSALTPLILPALLPGEAKRGIVFAPPGARGPIPCRSFLGYSFTPGLFVFSAATILSDLAGYEVESPDGLISLTAATVLLLPLVFVPAAKMALDAAALRSLAAGRVYKVDLLPYFEEFTGLGAALGLLVYSGGLVSRALSARPGAPASSIGASLGYLAAYLLLVLYPSAVATLVYASLGLGRARRRLLAALRPSFVEARVSLHCYNCGVEVSGLEEECPRCGARLKPAG